MKKIIIIALMAVIMTASTITPVCATASDYQLAKDWRDNHYSSATIEKVYTRAQGGYKGRITDTSYTVKYPKKVTKGKKVTVYFVVKGNDIKAMVCLGKVK